MGDFQKAIEYHGKHLKTAVEIGDWAGEGKACANHDIAFSSLGDFRKLIENHAKALSSATFDPDETLRLFRELSTQIIFLGLQGLRINIWFLSRGKKVAFSQGTLDADITEKDPIRAFLEAALRKSEAEV